MRNSYGLTDLSAGHAGPGRLGSLVVLAELPVEVQLISVLRVVDLDGQRDAGTRHRIVDLLGVRHDLRQGVCRETCWMNDPSATVHLA